MAAAVTPNKVGLVEGHALPGIADLFQALLLISANDAAIALAQATGSYAKGVAMMNAEAHQLQADDTVARRPNGLNAHGQHTSAYDLALFARQALTMPAFMKIEATRVAMFPLHRQSLGQAVSTRTRCSPPTPATWAARSAGPPSPRPRSSPGPGGTATRSS